MQKPTTVVLIHGLFVTALSWEMWVARYTQKGYRVIAESWPGMDDIQALRRDPTAVENIGIEEVVDHYDRLIRQLDAPPIVMGHSFGGAFTEILLDRGLGAAGVAIDAAAVRGILRLPLSQLRAGFPVLKSPANFHKAVQLTPEQFHYAFTNTLSDADAKAAYERYAAPGPGRVLFQGALVNFNPHSPAAVDFKRDRAPLLLIAGGSDNLAPAVIDRSMADHYARSGAVTEYKLFPGRSHWTIAEPGWEEVADYALEWAVANARTTSTTTA
jgi:pimeloyl-ACP methyl ester carboxylesterase